MSGTTTNTLGLTPATAGSLTLQATVTDSAGSPVSKSGTVQVTVLAAPSPVALAIPAIPKQYVDEGTTGVAVTAVTTGGTGNYSYTWQFVPSGGLTSLTLTGATTNVVRFDAPQVSAQSALHFRVTVNDGAAAPVTQDAWVVVNDITLLLALVLTAPEITGFGDYTVFLSAGAVRGGTGPYTYSWTQTAGPTVTLTGGATDNPSFVAPNVPPSIGTTPLTFTLTVIDAAGAQQTVTQRVVVHLGFEVRAFTCPKTVQPGQQFTVKTEVSKGTPPYLVQWTTANPVIPNIAQTQSTTITVPADVFQNGATVMEFRRCVDEPTCDSLWYKTTSDDPLCLNFDPGATHAGQTLICHLCCYGDECNVNTNPPDHLLFRP